MERHGPARRADELIYADAGRGRSHEMVEERLPFQIKLAQTEAELRKAVAIRHSAYARHVPDVARGLASPEAYDFGEDTAVLLALSKLDGEPIGTMRIQSNRSKRLALEDAVQLPDWLDGHRMAQASRLGVALGALGRVVKTALFKAYYQYCLQTGVDWMVIAARAPLDRQYQALLFEDLDPEARFIPLRHAANIPHRLMALETAAVEPKWRAAGHPLYGYFFKTRHPDIDLIDRRAVPRRDPAPLPAGAEFVPSGRSAY
jgi:hypothetical protein